MATLTQETITFGKYRGKDVNALLRDRSYCQWLVQQEWFTKNYGWLFERVKNHNPRTFFLPNPSNTTGDFLTTYPFFQLLPLDKIVAHLSEVEKQCYVFYRTSIFDLRRQIEAGMTDPMSNPYAIKAPRAWLKTFEETTGLAREQLKEFLSVYDLPNLPHIIEEVKKQGGLVYNGARSFLIAKSRSEAQEKYWEEVLRILFGKELGVQYRLSLEELETKSETTQETKPETCFFDFIHIPSQTIFECKLGVKDFNNEQYRKYRLVLHKYRIVYLIAQTTAVFMDERRIITTNSQVNLSVPGRANEGAQWFAAQLATFRFDVLANQQEFLNALTEKFTAV